MTTLDWAQLIKDAADSSGGGNYEPLPDGDYEFSVVEAPVTETQSGKTMFKLKAQVAGGAHDKRLVWDNLVVSPENSTALGIFFRKMNCMGLTQEFFDRTPSNEQISQALTGRRFRGQVGTRTYNGKTSNEIKNYYPSQAGAVPSAPGQTAAAPAPAPAPAAAPAPAPAPAAAPAPSAAPSAPF
jgi:hypothetical protein